MTVSGLCSSEGLSLDAVLADLAARGFAADAGMTVRQAADLLGVRPSEAAATILRSLPAKADDDPGGKREP